MLYGALAAIVLLLLGVVLYRQIDQFLLDNTASRLRSQARATIDYHTGGRFTSGFPVPAARVIPVPPGEAATPPQTVDSTITFLAEPSIVEMAANIVRELTTADTSAVVLDAKGNPIPGLMRIITAPSVPPSSGQDVTRTTYPPTFGITVERPDVPSQQPNSALTAEVAAAATEKTYLSTDPETGERVMVMLLPLQRAPDNTVIGVLQVVTSLQPADDLLARLRLLLMLGLGGALAVSILVGVPLTRAALRPLDRLVDTTARIAGDDLTARSALPHGSDEIGRLAASFDQMLGRIEDGVRAQRQFVADAAHELRTPLTAIGGLIELLLLGADNEDRATRRRTLVTVDRDLTRLTRLVNDLLSLSRHDLSIPHEQARVDLVALVADIHALTAELSADRVVTLERLDGPVEVRGDPDHLRQVLLNLAENARRYTPASGSITFRVRHNRRAAEVAVVNTGPGIAEEDLPRIFERFYRGGPARDRGSGGSGLGLAIARAIARAHGGTLTVESTPGRGAAFLLRLPLASPAVPHSGDRAGASASSSNL